MPSGARNWLTPAAWVAAVAALLLLLFPAGFPNYDTIYSLLWGRELAEGLSPDRGAALPPTPHPLTELWGLATSPLGHGAIDLKLPDVCRSSVTRNTSSGWSARWTSAAIAIRSGPRS